MDGTGDFEWLADRGLVEEYMRRLAQAFNPAACAPMCGISTWKHGGGILCGPPGIAMGARRGRGVLAGGRWFEGDIVGDCVSSIAEP